MKGGKVGFGLRGGREVDVHHLLLIVEAMKRAIELQRHNW